MKVQLVIDRNYALIENERINRPALVSPLQWLKFWENYDTVKSWQDGYDEGKEAGYEEGLLNRQEI